MKIYIESVSIFRNRSGVGQYTKRLSETLVKVHPQDEFTFFSFRLFYRRLPQKVITGPNAHYHFIRFWLGKAYNLQLRLHIAPPIDWLLRARPDIILFPNFYRWPVFSRKIKTIVVIHDLSFIYFPQFASPRNLRDNLRFTERSIAKADKVVTVSENSKQSIVEKYPLAKAKIEVVTPAVDHKFFYRRAPAEIKKVKHKYGLPEKYILFTSTLEPRKNVQGLVQAYSILPGELKEKFGLVLVGGAGWQDEIVHQSIGKAKTAGDQIIQLGYVVDEDMPAVYSGADLFVFPSFYEGFGIPVLEAMACGVPVISGDNSSLPEVAGDAAVLVKSEDTEAICRAMVQVLTDPKLAESLSRRGLAQSKKFSWEKSADKLYSIFKGLSLS